LEFSPFLKAELLALLLIQNYFFAYALKVAASGIILAHSRPSGSLQASQADIDLNKKLKSREAFRYSGL
jgi:hypothetical protein